jgi:hypothetical protein
VKRENGSARSRSFNQFLAEDSWVEPNSLRANAFTGVSRSSPEKRRRLFSAIAASVATFLISNSVAFHTGLIACWGAPEQLRPLCYIDD